MSHYDCFNEFSFCLALLYAGLVLSHIHTPQTHRHFSLPRTSPTAGVKSYRFQMAHSMTGWATIDRAVIECAIWKRSEEHTSELQSQSNLVCRLLLEKKKKNTSTTLKLYYTA